MSAQFPQDSGLVSLPQDVWGHILSYADIDQLKNYCLISKAFPAIIENGCKYMCTHFKLGMTQELSFRRIINLGNLIREWTLPKDADTILHKAITIKKEIKGDENRKAHIGAFQALLKYGITLQDYRPKLVDSRNKREIACFGAIERQAIDFMRADVIVTFLKSFRYFSIQDFLEIARAHIKTDDRAGCTTRAITYMTSNIFPNHPAKEDFSNLITLNVDDLFFALKNDPKKADTLLEENLSTLTDQELKYIILFYLCNYDVERLKNLLLLIKEKNRKLSNEIEEEHPGIQDVLDLTLDETIDRETIFVKWLVFFKQTMHWVTFKRIASHLSESGNISLLTKLQKEYDFNEDDLCFHHAKTAAVAEVLFAKVSRFMFTPFCGRSPLLTALMNNNMEVAEYLKNKGCTLEDDKNLTVIRLLFSKSNDVKWFILKDLIYRVVRAVVVCIAAVVAFCIIAAGSGYIGVQLAELVVLPLIRPFLH